MTTPLAALFTGNKPPVKRSPDLARILALPRRPPVEPGTATAEALINLAVQRYGRGPRQCRCAQIQQAARIIPKPCIMRPNYVQAWALHECSTVGGMLGNIAVGGGKTFIDIMAAMALPNVQVAVLLVPSGLVKQLTVEYDLIAEHFFVPSLRFLWSGAPAARVVPGAPTVYVLPYSRFQRAESTVTLDHLKPDTLIIDEAQNLASMASTRSSRYLRFMAKYPITKVVAMSGTLTDDSIQDYCHHADFALKEGSPLPRDPDVCDEWGEAINPAEWTAPPGALMLLCNPDEHVQDGFHRRVVETPGVVATKGASIDAEMEILERVVPNIPEDVLRLLLDLRATWTRPDGEELLDALSVARCARELACGLYLKWWFPRGESESLVKEWKAARKEWHQELRRKLARREPHLDSPMLCANAAMRAWGTRGDLVEFDEFGDPYEDAESIAQIVGNPDLPLWKAETWPRWAAVKGLVRPSTRAVRVNDFLARDAAAWAAENLGIVWYVTVAFGCWVSEISGLPMHGGGPGADERIATERGDRSIIASIRSHGTGRDGLQRLFCTQLVAQPPASAVGWEQLLGRLSRIGQAASRVEALVYRHTPEVRECTDAAMRKALYVQRTWGSEQKLRAGWRIAA